MDASYHSTRSLAEPVDAKAAILAGLAPDGGLYVSDAVLEAPLDLAKLGLEPDSPPTYLDHARQILAMLLPGYAQDEIDRAVAAAYGTSFADPAITPVTPFGSDWRLELFHGPTCAFKDVALQMLPRLVSIALATSGAATADERVLILTATSGDTGKAALAGFADVERTGIVVFYPSGLVSDVQRLQMVTQPGTNVGVTAVRGTFDDAQSAVKRVFSDRALEARLAERGISLSSANSINVGRLVPQVVYYADAWCQLVRAGKVGAAEPVDFFVPTGNFGDILAGYLAKRLGLPVGRLCICSNANDVLVDFLATGVYDRRREFKKSISPSMDILVSSNLERLLYYESEGDCELVASLMADLQEKGVYTVPGRVMDRIRETFDAGRADDDATRAAIKRAWEEDGILIDPHTGVGASVMAASEPRGRTRVLLSTASPFKFPADVLAALGEAVDGSGFDAMAALARLANEKPPAALAELEGAPVRFDGAIAPSDAVSYVEAEAERLLL